MSFIGGTGLAGIPGGVGRFLPTRGRIQGGVQGLTYPSPFFDVAHTYLPTTMKHLFRWCRYYFLTNPLINTVVCKLSEYPITDIIFEHQDSETVITWTEYMQDSLGYRAFQVEVGLDFFVYGNAFISVAVPFTKYLTCSSCKREQPARKCRSHWTFTNYKFRLSCPSCGAIADAKVKDVPVKSASGIKLLRWNPEDMEVVYNDLTGKYTYFYTIPQTIRSDVVMGRKEIVEDIPQIFIQALKEQKGIIFSPEKLFHMRRPTLATKDRGWGIPLLLPTLKNAFYLQLMQKAQETILIECILPMRVIFPQPASGTTDPFCVSPDTLVETVDGLLPAAEVHVGDYLRSHTGKWRRVLAEYRRQVVEKEKVYALRVASLSGFTSKLSKEHPVLAIKKTQAHRRGYGRQRWVDPDFFEAQELRRGDLVAYPKNRIVSSESVIDLAEYLPNRGHTDDFVYRCLGKGAAVVYEYLEVNNDPTFHHGERKALLETHGWTEKDYAAAYAARQRSVVDRMPRYLPLNEHLATLVGYFLAEGCLNNGGLPCFCFHLKETHAADAVEHAATALGFRSTSRYLRPAQNDMQAVVQDVLLGELLETACGKYAKNKQIPQFMSEAQTPVLLRALYCLFDGDGCSYETSTDRIALKTVSPNLALETRRLLLSFNLLGCVQREVMDENDIAVQDAFHVNYNGPQAQALRELLHNGVAPSTPPFSKCGLFRGDYVLLRIDDLEEVSDVREVIGFEMAADNSFCVAGVATHNSNISLVDWRDHIAMEIARWRWDPMYHPILPLPIGTQTIGGDGKSLLLTPEIQAWSEHIVVGMGVPREFVFGGMAYAGTQLSMRMVENFFLGYLLRHKALLKFVTQEVSSFLDWPMVRSRFRPFKMADDLQRTALKFQLNQANKISDTTLLADLDLSQEEEDRLASKETDQRRASMEKQQIAVAEIQGKAQSVMMKHQAKAQQDMAAAQGPPAPGAPGGPEPMLEQGGGVPGGQAGEAPAQIPAVPPPSTSQQFDALIASRLSSNQRHPQNGMAVDLSTIASMQAQAIQQMDPVNQQLALQNLRAQSPELADLVIQMLQQMKSAPTVNVDTRPLPEHRAPRRQTPSV